MNKKIALSVTKPPIIVNPINTGLSCILYTKSFITPGLATSVVANGKANSVQKAALESSKKRLCILCITRIDFYVYSMLVCFQGI